MLESEAQGLCVVSGNAGLGLCDCQLFACRAHFEVSVVDEPESANCRDSKGDTVGPLSREGRVWRISAAVVEDEQKKNEDGLVEELAPSLHQECRRNLASTVKTIFLGRDFA